MRLPGGLLRGTELKRALQLREPDGELELLVAQASRRASSLQDGVSRVLAAVVEDLDGGVLSCADAHELCVADRQFLMHRVAILLGMAQQWLQAACALCGARFEVVADLAALPVGEAGAGFPFVHVETAAGPLRLRVPTGADQGAIAGCADPAAAEIALLRRCVVDGALPATLAPEELARIDAALADVSPWVVTELASECPGCRAAHSVPLDPYTALRLSPSQLLDDVHTLAWHYHWSEAEILALPRERRQLYLSRVDRARGLTR